MNARVNPASSGAIPSAALWLGLAGLLPFIWGALTVISPDLQNLGLSLLGSRFVGPYVSLFYGAVILSFMSGVLWGFATQREGALGYLLSVIPALWVFFTFGGGAVSTAVALMAGFIGLLGLDWYFWRMAATPVWWMQLRILLTAIVVACLAVVAFFA